MIEVQNLSFRYNADLILNDLTFTLNDNETTVVIGRSGVGKSTLLRCILGLTKPESGRIFVDGTDITSMSEQELNRIRRNIGMLFQGAALFNSMTVGDNVCMPLREHTSLDANTMRIMSRMKLEVVNLAGFEHLMPAQLSGGMTKRAALARALVMDPSILFFDEPSAGLDPVVAADLDKLILRIRDAMQVSIVVVTHELESAFAIADRITVLDHGRILMTGTVDEVRNSTNQRVQNLLTRTSVEEPVNADEYLQRLTEGAAWS